MSNKITKEQYKQRILHERLKRTISMSSANFEIKWIDFLSDKEFAEWDDEMLEDEINKAMTIPDYLRG